MKLKLFFFVLSLLFLGACSEELRWETGGAGGAAIGGGAARGGGGGTTYAPPPAAVPNGSQPMLRDPDAEMIEHSEYVWAVDAAAAERQCRRIAERKNGEYHSIDGGSSWTSKYGDRRFTCFYLLEGEVKYDDE